MTSLSVDEAAHAACKRGIHELCYLAILDDQQQMAGTIIVNGALLPQLVNKKHRFLGLSRSTLYRIDEDPSWDPITHSFQHWHRQKPPLKVENAKEDLNHILDRYRFLLCG